MELVVWTPPPPTPLPQPQSAEAPSPEPDARPVSYNETKQLQFDYTTLSSLRTAAFARHRVNMGRHELLALQAREQEMMHLRHMDADYVNTNEMKAFLEQAAPFDQALQRNLFFFNQNLNEELEHKRLLAEFLIKNSLTKMNAFIATQGLGQPLTEEAFDKFLETTWLIMVQKLSTSMESLTWTEVNDVMGMSEEDREWYLSFVY